MLISITKLKENLFSWLHSGSASNIIFVDFYILIFVGCLICFTYCHDLPNYRMGAFTYDVRYFLAIFDLPTPLPKNRTSYVNAPQEGISFRTQFPSLGISINKKVGNRKKLRPASMQLYKLIL